MKVRNIHPSKRFFTSQNGGAPSGVERIQINNVVTGMKTPTATTWSTHRWNQRGSRRGQTSKSVKAVVAERPNRG